MRLEQKWTRKIGQDPAPFTKLALDAFIRGDSKLTFLSLMSRSLLTALKVADVWGLRIEIRSSGSGKCTSLEGPEDRSNPDPETRK